MYVADAVWRAVYTALNGTITGGVHDQVPTSGGYPYTVIGEDTDVPDDLHDVEGSEMTATLHVWSAAAGGGELDTIMAEIDAALNHEALTVAGARCWAVTREFTTKLRDQDPDTGEPLRHGIMRFRINMEET